MMLNRPAAVAVSAVLMLAGGPVSAEMVEADLGTRDGVWSEPVHGLRVRMVADRRQVPHDEGLTLFVMIQNVTDASIVLPALELMPVAGLAEDDHPFRSPHPFNAMIIARPVDTAVKINWNMWNVAVAARREVAIAPGDLHLAVIRLVPHEHVAMEMLAEGDVARERVAFDWFGPGLYEFQLLYAADGLAPGPDVIVDADAGPPLRLVTPPLVVQALGPRPTEGQAPVDGR